MSTSFGYSERFARTGHDCDRCDFPISAGEYYGRYLIRSGRKVRPIKYHCICPPDLDEFNRMGDAHAESRVAIAIEMKLVNRVAVLANGDTVVESVLVAEPVAVSEPHDEPYYDLDDEVPF